MISRIWKLQDRMKRLMLALDGHAADADGGVNVQLVVVPHSVKLPDVLLGFIAGEEITERTCNIDNCRKW